MFLSPGARATSVQTSRRGTLHDARPGLTQSAASSAPPLPFFAAVTTARASMKSALLFLAGRAAGHGILTSPAPRTGAGLQGGTVIKLTSFNNARSVANEGCGGTLNNDPGFDQNVNEPENVYTPGQSLGVQWDITIPVSYTHLRAHETDS